MEIQFPLKHEIYNFIDTFFTENCCQILIMKLLLPYSWLTKNLVIIIIHIARVYSSNDVFELNSVIIHFRERPVMARTQQRELYGHSLVDSIITTFDHTI